MARPRCLFVLLAASLATTLTLPAHAQTYTLQPNPRVQEDIKPTRIVQRDDGTFFLDFGRAAYAQFELTLTPTSADAGKKITLRLGEMLASPNHLNPKPGGSIRFLENALTLQPGKSAYRPELTKNDARLMPADIGAVMPFRYVELIGLPAGTTAENLRVRQIAVHYPFDDSASDFSCSDDQLNAVWNLCKYSIKATSFAGVFVDGDRERKPYEADAYINQLGWYYVTTDTTLARYSHDTS